MAVRDSLRRSGLAAALVAVAVLSGCDRTEEGPVTPPGVGVPTAAPTAPSSAAALTYTATELDLCERTDLAPLADLELTVTRFDLQSLAGRPGAACLFEMRTKDGHQANLRVEASTPTTAEEAGQLYRATRQATGMTPAGPVTGVGEEAEAFTKQSTPGFSYAEYMVHARTGNLVVKVWLAVGGDSFIPTATLADKSLTILKATQAAVPTA